MTTPETPSPVEQVHELRSPIAKATDSDLTDNGRYFAETCDDLTRCRHEEVGEYQHTPDGKLVEWLWNRRNVIADALAERARLTTGGSLGVERYRHLKRGTVYEVVGRASLQNANRAPLPEAACMVIYRGEDGELWAREEHEFMDGRFERIAALSPPIPEQRVREALEAETCGATSDEAIRHLKIRDQLNRTIYKAVRGYCMGNMCDADDPSYPYPLVDLMSNPAPADISSGEMEIVSLADEIAAAVSAMLAATPSVPAISGEVEKLREAVKRLRFNADFRRGYGNSEFFMRRDDADLILDVLSTPSPAPIGDADAAAKYGVPDGGGWQPASDADAERAEKFGDADAGDVA